MIKESNRILLKKFRGALYASLYRTSMAADRAAAAFAAYAIAGIVIDKGRKTPLENGPRSYRLVHGKQKMDHESLIRAGASAP
jgi:inosine-uridine nucleoside N-ribohydrolase